jgi:hypothetical protein
MKNYDYVSPNYAKHIQGVRQTNLFDNSASIDKGGARFNGRSRYETPSNNSHRYIGKKYRNIHFKNATIYRSQQYDEYRHAEGDPKRPQSGTAVALPDVIPPKHGPQTPRFQPSHQIACPGG